MVRALCALNHIDLLSRDLIDKLGLCGKNVHVAECVNTVSKLEDSIGDIEK